MGPQAWVVIGLESRAVSARVTQHIITIFSQTYPSYSDRGFKHIISKAKGVPGDVLIRRLL